MEPAQAHLAGWIGLLLIAGCCACGGGPEPVSVILDTDLGYDCDDTGALATAHALADYGEINLLAVMSCTHSRYAPAAVDAINHFHGRPDLPIGALAPGDAGPDGGKEYPIAIAERFAHDLDVDRVPDAKVLYRQILAAQPDGSVTIVTVGMLSNIRHLLETGPDDISPLSGEELVAKKVTRLVTMGGYYPKPPGDEGEFNLRMDGPAAEYVFRNWPAPIVISPYDVGKPIMTGSRLHTETPESNPARVAYEIVVGGLGSRPSWDQTAVLYAARGRRDYWTVEENGRMEVSGKGWNEWRDTGGNHSVLRPLKPAPAMAVLIEDLMVKTPGPKKVAAARGRGPDLLARTLLEIERASEQ